MGREKEYNLLVLIWLIAFISTLGSLYYSEVLGFVPCVLCWYQRILMYPLVLLYGYAIYKGDYKYAGIGIVMSGLGIMLGLYNYLKQKTDIFNEDLGSCGFIPCNVEYVNYLGFITIPFMSMVAFTFIFIIHIYLIRLVGKK